MASIAPSVDFSIRPVLAHGFTALSSSRGFLEQLLATMSDEQLMARACPGMNHAVWIVGHIAWTEDYFRGHGLHRLRGTIQYPTLRSA